MLKPGGKLILTTIFMTPLNDAPIDYGRFTKFGLEKLLSDWRIVSIEARTKTFSTIATSLQRICYQTNLRGGKFTKLLLFLMAWCFDHVNWLILKEYGDIKREYETTDILTYGYHVVAVKTLVIVIGLLKIVMYVDALVPVYI